jgi:hypothetical protein
LHSIGAVRAPPTQEVIAARSNLYRKKAFILIALSD